MDVYSSGVIVTYNPDAQFKLRMQSIQRQVEKLLIVDNGSNPLFINELRGYLFNFPNVELLELGENKGIAAALNFGLARLKDYGYCWSFTFDHDSLAPALFCDSMIQSAKSNQEVALVSPAYINKRTGTDLSPQAKIKGSSSDEILTTITSGNLVSLAKWEKVGGFDEALFVDCVDHDFCLRCQQEGFRLILNKKAVLSHDLGEARIHKVLGKTLFITNHSPTRRYYITRNCLYVYTKYFWFQRAWAIFGIKSLIKQSIHVLLFEQDRLEKFRMMLMGSLDFLRNKRGALRKY